MRLLVHFNKMGSTAYVSHLDLQSAMQRIFRKAGIPLKYSQGFNPHPQTSFAMASPVGMESMAMYVDIKIEDTDYSEVENIRKNLMKALPDALRLERVRIVNDDYPKLTAAITCGEFLVSFRGTNDIMSLFNEYMEQEEIIIQKKGKGGVKPLDIKPYILSFKPAGIDNNSVKLYLKAGSSENLNPMLLGKDICEHFNLDGFKCIQMALYSGEWNNQIDLFALDSEVF